MKLKKVAVYVLAGSIFAGTVLGKVNCQAMIVWKILNWNLVDSGKHLDWGGSTNYLKRFNLAVDTWNAYKPGVIRKDDGSKIRDVTISDYTESSEVLGVTSSKGTIKFNQETMHECTKKVRRNVCTHELGHALGLAHNTEDDVMYMYATDKVTLSDNDKASYNHLYRCCY